MQEKGIIFSMVYECKEKGKIGEKLFSSSLLEYKLITKGTHFRLRKFYLLIFDIYGH